METTLSHNVSLTHVEHFMKLHFFKMSCSLKVMKVQTVKLTSTSVPSIPVRMTGNVSNVLIRLTGNWNGNSALRTQPDIFASVSRGLQVG